DSPFGARPASGTPADSPFGARPASGTPADSPFGARPASGTPADSPFGARPASGTPADSPFGARPASGTPGSPGESGFGPSAAAGAGFPPADAGAHPVSGGFGQAPDSRPFGPDGDDFPASPDGFDDHHVPDRFGPPPNRPGTYGTPASPRPDSAPPADAPFGAASGPFGAAPTSGGADPSGRVAGRASASARVAPPGQPFTPAPASPAPNPGDGQNAPNPAAFSEFTTDIAGRGRPGAPGQPGPVPGNPAARTMPPDFTEHTTDVAGRGQGPEQPYVPAPALPAMHAAPPLENGFPPPDSTQPFGDRPRMGGVFPGPASRATVTPPDPEQTSSWPNSPGEEADQGRFDSFKPETQPVAEPPKPETPHVRMLPVLLGVILGAGLLVGLTFGITWLIARGSDSGGFSVAIGDCVKRDGTKAVTAKCSDAGSYEVTAIVDTPQQCPDPLQPHVLNPAADNKTKVLCLKQRG
ncbi:hypothetical protein AB0J80_25885, partial [Actinoplanes sp. NPDC049548]